MVSTGSADPKLVDLIQDMECIFTLTYFECAHLIEECIIENWSSEYNPHNAFAVVKFMNSCGNYDENAMAHFKYLLTREWTFLLLSGHDPFQYLGDFSFMVNNA